MELLLLLLLIGLVLSPGWFAIGAFIALIHELLKNKKEDQ